jgi:hypothetical protein
MSNISIDLNLRQLKHAIFTTAKGTECILLPIDENQFIRGEKGIYLNATGFEIKNKVGDSKNTHLVKQTFKKEVYEKMSDEQKKELPILGNLIVWSGSKSEPEPNTMQEDFGKDATDDLPF